MTIDQKTRNKIAAGLSVVLVPLMIYLLFTNIGRAGKKSRIPMDTRETSAPAASSSSDALKSISQIRPVEDEAETIDPEVLRQQKEIAALKPKRNPFAVTEGRPEPERSADISPVVERPQKKAPALIKVTGIVSGSGGRRMAIINGRMLGVGESIGGWTIVKIVGKSVTLDDGQKQITVKAR